MNYSIKTLLTPEEKNRASKSICSLEYMKNPIKEKRLEYRGNKFCNIRRTDKIYFFKEIIDGNGMISTEYLLVRDDKAFESIEIERKYSKELGKNIPIIEKLH